MSESFTIRVNGLSHQVQCDPDTPVIYILRNDLGLFGTRFGCGLGQCGACTVLVDGAPIHSCDTPIWSIAGKAVTTVEGLGNGAAPHPLQRAFIEQQAFQCGYCSSGMIVTAAALLARHPTVDADGIRNALRGNLCRCGTQNRIVAAVLDARPSAT